MAAAFKYRLPDGRECDTLEEVIAALNAGGSPSAPASNEALGHVLADTDAMAARTSALFYQYAGADQKLQEHEMMGLVQSVAAQLGVDLREFVGDLRHLFHRYDFSGDGELDLKEATLMVQSMLERYQLEHAPPDAGEPEWACLPHKDPRQDYNLTKKLGEGGMGIVYLAEAKATGEPRVVKFMDKSKGGNDLASLVQECKLLKTLDHPKVTRVYEVFQDRANFYTVSEPYGGGDLVTLFSNAQRCGARIDVGYIGKVMLQVAQGLAYCHSRCVMHLDMKEPNVMISTAKDDIEGWQVGPRAVIIDFGMAVNLTGGEFSGGTPGYLPPEIYTSQLATPKCDVFALGVIFYQVLTGKVPSDTCPQRLFEPSAQDGGGFNVCSYNVMNYHPDLSIFAPYPGVAELLGGLLSKDLRARYNAQMACDHPFFASLDSAGAMIDADVVAAMANLGEKSKLAEAVLTDLADTKNFAGLKTLNMAFMAMDTDHTGELTPEQVRTKLLESMPAEQVDATVSALVGSSGVIHYREFIGKMLVAKQADAKSLLWEQFKTLDTSGDGTLDREELSQMLNQSSVAKVVGDEGIHGLMAQMDPDGDGKVTFEEFCRVLMGESRRAGYVFGQEIEYHSASNGRWIPCAVTAVHNKEYVQINVKPGAWLRFDDPKLRAP